MWSRLGGAPLLISPPLACLQRGTALLGQPLWLKQLVRLGRQLLKLMRTLPESQANQNTALLSAGESWMNWIQPSLRLGQSFRGKNQSSLQFPSGSTALPNTASAIPRSKPFRKRSAAYPAAVWMLPIASCGCWLKSWTLRRSSLPRRQNAML